MFTFGENAGMAGSRNPPRPRVGRRKDAVAEMVCRPVGDGHRGVGRLRPVHRAAKGGSPPEKGTIGIAMPTKSSERWVGDGQNMVNQFQALGYKTDLQYGDDVVQNQVSQIENMITKGVQLLVIAPIDGSSLTNTLQRAADAKIPVISYDRLIKAPPRT